MSIAIFPESMAAMLKSRAGEPYRPSNGTEGEIFMHSWCRHCQRDRAMREGDDFDDCDDDELCDIIASTMAFNIGEEGYPKEWQYDANGQPCCTAFVQAGHPIPLRDDKTMDLFGGAA